MRYIFGYKVFIFLNLCVLVMTVDHQTVNKNSNEQLTQSSLKKSMVINGKLNAAETKMKESESAGHNKMEIKEQKGQSEKFHKENDFKKKEEAHGDKQSSDKSSHENLKAGEEGSKLKKKQSDELGHDEGKKSAQKIKKSGDNLDIEWNRGSGFVKQWNFDKGSKKKKGYHLEDEGKLKKYNKNYKAEKGSLSKGHHGKYKKHNADYKDAWDSNHWGQHKGAYGHDMKHGGNHHEGYYKKAKAAKHHEGWNQHHVDHHDWHPKHHDEHDSGYDWRF